MQATASWHRSSDVTIIGLGMMGQRLAELYLEQGKRVTVWNRNPERAAALVARGAVLATDPVTALQASPLILMCVANDDAVAAILTDLTPDLAGKTVVQLTTISPSTARAGERWTHDRGGRFLSGAIQAAPAQMGQPDTPILFSGASSTWEASRAALATLGGGLTYLGDDPGAASTMDLATLSWVYGAFLGFVHGAKIARAENLDVATYGKIVRDISPSFGAFFQHEGEVIQSGDYRISQSPLQISVDATRRLVDTARASGLTTELPALAAAIFERAAKAGLAGEEAAAIIKVM